MIWLATLAMTLSAIALLLWLHARSLRRRERIGREQVNRMALREALDEVEQRRVDGELDEQSAQALIAELSRRADEELAGGAPAQPAPAPDRLLLGLAALALLAALGLWAASGSWRTAERITLAERFPELSEQLARDELRDYVARHPQDASAWAALGERELLAGNASAAAEALRQANRLAATPSPDWLVSEGEALALASGHRLEGRPAELFRRALELDAEHPRALWFSALHALQQGDAARARELFGRMRAIEGIPPQVRDLIDSQLARLDGASPAQDSAPRRGQIAPQAAADDATAGPVLRVRVEYEGDPRGVLYVFARPAGATGGPPLAVRRVDSPRFPLELELGDADAMMPGMRLSDHDRVTVVARLSRSGNIRGQGDDPEASAQATPGGAVAIVLPAR